MLKSLSVSMLVACGLAYSDDAFAQVSSADVNVMSVNATTSGTDFICTAVINNQNDDDAINATVIVLLPLQVQKIKTMTVDGVTGACKKAPKTGTYFEYATCNLGELPQGPTVLRTIQITTSRSTAAPAVPQTCSAFIFSRTGDIQKNNNYMASNAVP